MFPSINVIYEYLVFFFSELPAESSVKSLHTKTLYVRVFPTTAEA